LWYPAAAGSVESEWYVGVFRFGRNALEAPFADTRRHPLIVLSHGTGGSAAQLSWLAGALVNTGFVVAAVNHHGNTATEDTAWPQGFVLPAERARDLIVLIDRLLADTQPIRDPRIRAVYAIAPASVALLHREELASIGVPVRFALATDDQYIVFRKTLRAIEDHLPNATVITIQRAGHHAFLAPCSLRGTLFLRALCTDAREVDRRALHNRVGRDAATFFDNHLRP